MARDESTATKYAKGTPKFSEVLKRKKARLHNYGGNSDIYMYWDYNDGAKEAQMFRIHSMKGEDEHELVVSKQELMHYLRAV